MRVAHRAVTALLACVAAGALTAATPSPSPAAAELEISPVAGVSGTEVSLTPHLAAGSCTLSINGAEVDTTLKCSASGDGDRLVYRTVTHVFSGQPGTYTIRFCLPRCSAGRSTVAVDFQLLAVVPDLGELTLPQAKDALRKAGLAFGGVTKGSATDSDARVSSQSRKPGEAVTADTKVAVTMSAPPVMITVPDVRQHSLDDAQKILTGLGLKARPSAPQGSVVGQDPAPGTKVAPGFSVGLTVQVAIPSPSPTQGTSDPSTGRRQPDASPPYAAIAVALALVILVVFLTIVLVRRLPDVRRRLTQRAVKPPDVDVRLLPPPQVTTTATASSPEPAVDVHIRLTRKVTVTAESRTP